MLCPLVHDDFLNSLYNPSYIHLFFSFLLIYKTRSNDFDLQLGCCISDTFSIFVIILTFCMISPKFLVNRRFPLNCSTILYSSFIVIAHPAQIDTFQLSSALCFSWLLFRSFIMFWLAEFKDLLLRNHMVDIQCNYIYNDPDALSINYVVIINSCWSRRCIIYLHCWGFSKSRSMMTQKATGGASRYI